MDYKVSGREFSFPANVPPTPRSLPLRILRTGRRGKRTVVIRMVAATSIANVGPVSTYTYTIDNP